MQEDFNNNNLSTFGMIVLKNFKTKKEAMEFEAYAIGVLRPAYNTNSTGKKRNNSINGWRELFGKIKPQKDIYETSKQIAA